MSTILAFSDTHVHRWWRDVHTNSNGWRTTFALLRMRLRNAIEKIRPDLVVFGGDLFEIKSRHDAAVWQSGVRLIDHIIDATRCAYKDACVVLLSGNHDVYAPGHSVLDVFEGRSRVFVVSHRPRLYHNALQRSRSIPLLFIPHTLTPQGRDDMKLRADNDDDYYLAFTHADLQGMRIRKGLISDSTSIDTRLLYRGKRQRRHAIVNGHYHFPQQTLHYAKHPDGVPIMQIGAPMSHHWGDADDEHQCDRGYVLIDIDDNDLEKPPRFERMPLGFPTFKTYDDAASMISDAAKGIGRRTWARVRDVSEAGASNLDGSTLRNLDVASDDARRMLIGYMKETRNETKKLDKARRRRRLRIGRKLYTGTG